MAGSVLLDTNIVIAFLEREREVVQNIVNAVIVSVPVVVFGELEYGALKSTRTEENLGRIDGLKSWVEVPDCNLETAEHWGEIKAELERKGRLIPDNDIWVAASARQEGLTLVSRDQHFAAVDGLHWEQW